MTDVAISAEGLGKRYRIRERVQATTLAESARTGLAVAARRVSKRRRLERKDFWALRDVSFQVDPGEILGVIGRNGAGKSSLLKILARITEPTEGTAVVRGRVGSLLEVGTGFHPELTGRDNVYLNGAILGMRRSEIARKFDEIVEFSGVEQFIDVPVKRFSSGMHVRLAFAVAAFLEPEILLVDEVLSVGDQAFQERCLGRMHEVTRDGRTVIFVSHNLAAVQSLCDRGLLLDGGRVVFEGTVGDTIEHYLTSIATTSQVSVRERQDRRGTGALRFTDVAVTSSAAGPVLVGGDAEIALGYESDAEPRHLFVSIAVAGPLGEPLFLCSNELSGDDLANATAIGTFRCTIPKLPLQPGRYSLNVFAQLNGVIADWIEHAAFFEVIDSDVFGTGRLPPASHGPLVLQHSWSAEAAERDAATRASASHG